MTELDKEIEEFKKVEAQLHNQLMADLEKTLEEQAQFSNYLNSWVSAIGKENIQAIYYENRLMKEFL